MPHWIHDRAAAFNRHHRSSVITDRRSASAAQEDSVKKLLLAGLLAMVALVPTFAGAQTQAEEKMLVGEVQSIDQTGTQITLKDGTTFAHAARVDAPARRARTGYARRRHVPGTRERRQGPDPAVPGEPPA